MGLRVAIGGFVLIACYGIAYVIDRRGNWFDLNDHVVLAVGHGAHLYSLLTHVRYRRRKADLHLLFVFTSAFWLVALVVALAAALTVGHRRHLGVALTAAAVAMVVYAVCLGFAASILSALAIGGVLLVVTGLCVPVNVTVPAVRLLSSTSSDRAIDQGGSTTP